jgi:hypothetical protein
MPPRVRKGFSLGIRDVGTKPRGLLVTLFVNWLVKPFSMAFIAWFFFRYVFAAWIPAVDADQLSVALCDERVNRLRGIENPRRLSSRV